MLRLPAGRQAQCAANKVFSYFRVLASMAYRLIRRYRESLTFSVGGRTIGTMMVVCKRRFFIPGVSRGGRVTVAKEEARHITRVLRLGVGDELTAFDGTGTECRCRIADGPGSSLVVEVLECREVSRELPVSVTLAIAASKARAMDLLVQKCTELGVARLLPFYSGRSVARGWDAAKVEKWRRTAVEAAKQCGRNVVPQIEQPVDAAGLAEAFDEHDVTVVAAASEKTRTLKEVLREHPTPGRIACVIGPEGGFSPDELAALTAAGARPVSLGPAVLRVETAAMATLAMIAYEYCL